MDVYGTDETIYILLLVSFLGSLLNWSILYSTWKLPSLNQSFGYLSANQALADALHSTMFFVYFCPMVLLDLELLKQYSHVCGAIMLFCYELSVFTHLMISINRFYAIWAPYKYKTTFSDSRTKKIIFMMWIFVGFMNVILYQKLCHFYYEEKIHFMTFTSTEFCGIIGLYGDFLKNAAVVAVVMCIDLLTIARVRMATKKVSSHVTEATHHKMSSREIRFLRQTVVQGSVFMLELLTYYVVPKYSQNKWIVFFATSFAWVAVHAADGIVVLICNPEIRRALLGKRLVNRVTSTVAATTTNQASHQN